MLHAERVTDLNQAQDQEEQDRRGERHFDNRGAAPTTTAISPQAMSRERRRTRVVIEAGVAIKGSLVPIRHFSVARCRH
jgi:hypothetical protein